MHAVHTSFVVADLGHDHAAVDSVVILLIWSSAAPAPSAQLAARASPGAAEATSCTRLHALLVGAQLAAICPVLHVMEGPHPRASGPPMSCAALGR
jgi:hypothetical protein